MSNIKENSSCGSIIGFSVPEDLKQRKKHIDEMLSCHKDINPLIVLSFLSNLKDDEEKKYITTSLDMGKYDDVANKVREYAIREVVKGKLKEVVRKKKGGGGYTLYAPNVGKKGTPKAVGSFPTKIGAKRAELARFPPRDPGRLARLRKEVQKLQAKRESIDKFEYIKPLIEAFVAEAMFRGEKSGSDWTEFVDGIPSSILAKDSNMQKMQRNIDKKTEQALKDALADISKAVKKSALLKQSTFQDDPKNNRVQIAFNVEIDGKSIGPIFIFINNGVPQVELSSSAKDDLTRVDGDKAKLFRAELITVQERVLDKIDYVSKAISARDNILDKLHTKVEEVVAGLSDIEKLMFKRLISTKFKGNR